MEDDGNWTQWSKHVLYQLEQLNGQCDTIRKDLNKVCMEIAQLKVKAGIWGLVGGALPTTVAIGIYFFKVMVIQ